tara:strand:+ start:33364 stop:33885 length:522 start_codon:yes stop_codon:yes gene_type:complete
MSLDDQFFGADTATNDAYVGKARTITIDTETWSLRVHDGVTAGGRVVTSEGSVSAIIDALAGEADGLASLDGDGLLPESQLPIKIWHGTVTSDGSGDFAVDYSSKSFASPPTVTVSAQLSTATVTDRAWATLAGAPTSSACAGYTLRGVTIAAVGETVREAPSVVVNVIAIGV